MNKHALSQSGSRDWFPVSLGQLEEHQKYNNPIKTPQGLEKDRIYLNVLKLHIM